jgi:hypothetical protein
MLARSSGAPFDFLSIRAGERELQLCAIGASLESGRPASGRTLMRTDLRRTDGFRFRISSRTPIDGLARLFGAQDIAVGHADFDRAHVVKGSPEARVRQLFDHEPIRSALRALRASGFEFALTGEKPLFGSRLPAGCGELCFYNAHILDDLAALRSLHQLFLLTLDELCEMGSIAGARASAAPAGRSRTDALRLRPSG